MSTDTPLHQARADDAAYYKRVLHDLIDMGNDLARIVHDQAKRQAGEKAEAATAVLPPIPAANDRYPDLTVAFDRIARSVRRTILLAQKLEEPAPNHSPNRFRIAARKRILRTVEDTIKREAKTEDRPALRAELLDRLDAPDLEDDIDTIPIEDIITDICRDLHLTFKTEAWSRRTPNDVEALRQTAASIPPTWTTPPHPQQPGPQATKPTRPKTRRYLVRDTG